uniref:(northern house mosquito) hypothetical protein n=1 Tax=Culex pipiens TaxID=7175 RepID=A0A8D8ANT8_CULPI
MAAHLCKNMCLFFNIFTTLFLFRVTHYRLAQLPANRNIYKLCIFPSYFCFILFSSFCLQTHTGCSARNDIKSTLSRGGGSGRDTQMIVAKLEQIETALARVQFVVKI